MSSKPYLTLDVDAVREYENYLKLRKMIDEWAARKEAASEVTWKGLRKALASEDLGNR